MIRWAMVTATPEDGNQCFVWYDSLGAAALGDPHFGGRCPGYEGLFYLGLMRPSGWWNAWPGLALPIPLRSACDV